VAYNLRANFIAASLGALGRSPDGTAVVAEASTDNRSCALRAVQYNPRKRSRRWGKDERVHSSRAGPGSLGNGLRKWSATALQCPHSRPACPAFDLLAVRSDIQPSPPSTLELWEDRASCASDDRCRAVDRGAPHLHMVSCPAPSSKRFPMLPYGAGPAEQYENRRPDLTRIWAIVGSCVERAW